MTWLTTAEAAAHVRHNAHELRRMAEAHEVTAYKRCACEGPCRHQWRFDLADLDAWVRGEKPTRGPVTTRPRRRVS